jgi:hypothetical protein
MTIRPVNHMMQLSLFDTVILKNDHLTAPRSPRKAVYNIWLIREPGGFVVKKESGCEKKKSIVREWTFTTLNKAELFYDKKIKAKTNPDRRTRVYQPA